MKQSRLVFGLSLLLAGSVAQAQTVSLRFSTWAGGDALRFCNNWRRNSPPKIPTSRSALKSRPSPTTRAKSRCSFRFGRQCRMSAGWLNRVCLPFWPASH